jgi:hypothetical protein
MILSITQGPGTDSESRQEHSRHFTSTKEGRTQRGRSIVSICVQWSVTDINNDFMHSHPGDIFAPQARMAPPGYHPSQQPSWVFCPMMITFDFKFITYIHNTGPSHCQCEYITYVQWTRTRIFTMISCLGPIIFKPWAARWHHSQIQIRICQCEYMFQVELVSRVWGINDFTFSSSESLHPKKRKAQASKGQGSTSKRRKGENPNINPDMNRHTDPALFVYLRHLLVFI